MSRWHFAFAFFVGSCVCGCQSGPFADTGAGPDAQIDARVAALSKSESLTSRLFGARESAEEYTVAKKLCKQPEKVTLAFADWKLDHGRQQNSVASLEEARVAYTNILNDNPDSIRAMVGLANVDYHSDRIQDAESMFLTVLKKFPGNAHGIQAAAGFYNAEKRPEKAMALLSPALEREPENRDLRVQMGKALVVAGRTSEAIPHFTKCYGKARSLYNIGALLHELGDKSGADHYLSMALERNPEMKEASRMLSVVRGNDGLRHAVADGGERGKVSNAGLRLDGIE